MEAVFFRFLARELAALLPGCRVEKIFLPAQNVFSMALYLPAGREIPGGEGKKTVYLHARYGTGRFFLFLSPQKTVQPERAPAAAMRLRKHLRGRRVAGVLADWPHRRLTLVMAGEGPCLRLDPRSFPELCDAPPPPCPDDPGWPPLARVLAEPEIWREHPQLSPALRRRLAGLPRGEAEAVYARLLAPEAEGFFLELAKGEPDALWPVRWPGKDRPGRETRAFGSALAAAAAFGEPLAFGEVSGRQSAPQAAADAAATRRLSRALEKLAADEARMRAFLARKAQADILAANLHALNKQAKIAHLSLPGPDGLPTEIALDPSLTVVRNMQKLYDLAAKGERGLAAIARRRRDLQDGKKYLQGRQRGAPATAQPSRPAPGPFEGVAANAYRTDDGFLVLRGKNAKAGESLLRKANPFDLWFHVANGPGAHVILRRDHPRREVPRASLAQAAGLAALASYASGAGSAEVMMARAADVRRIKGAAAGKVAVEAVLETLRVDVDPGLESLRLPT
ncbi:NFACT RNA binding domain-containing protein [Solidesulfovibrio sp.]|uniref:NFACT RNA binding domain-containing protein n=1 Tax=Solidesulfovibrio sp. TaxID=2910990 RepID=UPI00261AF77D|nr:NFACT RNA binding domain-containing protein [Solidesulfovibrio sp.]